jgi:hypothetical protein
MVCIRVHNGNYPLLGCRLENRQCLFGDGPVAGGEESAVSRLCNFSVYSYVFVAFYQNSGFILFRSSAQNDEIGNNPAGNDRSLTSLQREHLTRP